MDLPDYSWRKAPVTDSKPKITKTWDPIQVDARCLAEGCTKAWEGSGNWPLAAASNHAKASGHQVEARSQARVLYDRV